MVGRMAYDDDLSFMPLVIIGAGRSGTNALRDALTRLQGFATWPCDEINPIWRHGNLDHPDDAIPPEKATPAVRRFIRGAFRRIWRQQGQPRIVVEKTCANTLRVPFVEAILPEARYVHIVRDGYDVVASAMKRWRGELEMPSLSYFLAKARYAPASDLPHYAVSVIRARFAVYAGRRAHLESWGPRFPGIDGFITAPLEEIVARQWVACVAESDAAFEQIAPERVFHLGYEEFVDDPSATISRIAEWIATPQPESMILEAAATVRRSAVGRGRAHAAGFPPDIRALLRPVRAAHGYAG